MVTSSSSPPHGNLSRPSPTVSHAAFKALETSEILLVSEYSYEVTMNTKFKSQDYELYYELVGANDRSEDVINLHRVYISLLVSLEEEIKSLIADDIALQTKFDKLMTKIKDRISTADTPPMDLYIDE